LTGLNTNKSVSNIPILLLGTQKLTGGSLFSMISYKFRRTQRAGAAREVFYVYRSQSQPSALAQQLNK
jgi:hypothetical protein